MFDGNTQDYRIGLDDGTDKLEIGIGTTHGTTTAVTIDSSQIVTFPNNPAKKKISRSPPRKKSDKFARLTSLFREIDSLK